MLQSNALSAIRDDGLNNQAKYDELKRTLRDLISLLGENDRLFQDTEIIDFFFNTLKGHTIKDIIILKNILLNSRNFPFNLAEIKIMLEDEDIGQGILLKALNNTIDDYIQLAEFRKGMLKNPPPINDMGRRSMYIGKLSDVEEVIAKSVPWETQDNEQRNALKALFSPEEIKYFQILNISKNQDTDTLKEIIQGEKESFSDIKYKLYALMQLKALGGTVDGLTTLGTLVTDTLKLIKEKAFVIGGVNSGTSNFDLRALTVGISLILTEILSNTGTEFAELNVKAQELYKAISQAIFVVTSGVVPSDSELVFSKSFLSRGRINTLYDCIAHELGHNYFKLLGLNLDNSDRTSTFHEFIAFTMQGLFAQNITSGQVTKIFKNIFFPPTWFRNGIPFLMLLSAVLLAIFSITSVMGVTSAIVLTIIGMWIIGVKNLFSFSVSR
jgi:hypothetical protein